MVGMGGIRTPSYSLRMGSPQLGQAMVGLSCRSTGVVIFQSSEVVPQAMLQRYYTAEDAGEATPHDIGVACGTTCMALHLLAPWDQAMRKWRMLRAGQFEQRAARGS